MIENYLLGAAVVLLLFALYKMRQERHQREQQTQTNDSRN